MTFFEAAGAVTQICFSLTTISNFNRVKLVQIPDTHGTSSCYLQVETCNTTDSLRKTATSRIESHMRHVICRVLTVYDSTRDVAYQGFTTIYLGRGMSHTVAYYWERHFWQT